MNNELPWPPEYQIRHSPRAKYVLLKISSQGQLEIVVPEKRRRLPNIENLLIEKRSWIEKNLKHRSLLNGHISEISFKPAQISLLALAQTWQVIYEAAVTRESFLERPGQQLVVLTSPEQEKRIPQLLAQWLRQQAQTFLIDRLHMHSQQIGLPFSKVTIRGQTSCWGSCTGKQNITLNFKLLFLPLPLVDYVLIHELCHTRHMNHSTRFWQLVEKFVPNWQQFRREVRAGQCYIPTWLERD